MKGLKITYIQQSKQYSQSPKEELLLLKKKNQKIVIGIPKESDPNELRVPITPDGVETLTEIGYRVVIQSGAGERSAYTDEDYIKRGAQIAYSKQELFERSDFIIKIAPFSQQEISELPKHKTIFSAIHLTQQRKENFTTLMEKKITAIAYEYYTDDKGFNPFLHVIGEIIGSSAIMIASELLTKNFEFGKGILLGSVTGIPPANIVILGSDTSAQQAVRTALGLGANVKIFDKSLENLTKIHYLFGKHIYTSTVNMVLLEQALAEADVVINALHREPNEGFIITREMVKRMKKFSVIIDLKIDSGTVIETSRITNFANPYYLEENVIHYCVPNLASRVSRTTSKAINNVLVPILRRIFEMGGFNTYIRNDKALQNATYIYNGILTNEEIARLFLLRSTSIDLFLDSFL